jgi:hypothetical protein
MRKQTLRILSPVAHFEGHQRPASFIAGECRIDVLINYAGIEIRKSSRAKPMETIVAT